MAKSFKEIGKKAEELLEQGKTADRKVQICQARVAASNDKVAAARRQLAYASRTDENGNPMGDVAYARVQLSMAENQLAASERALAAAESDSGRVKQDKNSHVQTIGKHNQAERANLDKLRKLRSGAFGSDSAALSKGMAERLNEAEDTRVKLLKSMGIDASPDYVAVTEDGSDGFGWQGGNFAALDITSQEQNHQAGFAGEQTAGGISAPIGGGLVYNSQPDNHNSDPFDNIIAEYVDYVNGILDRSNLTYEQRIAELDKLKSQLEALSQINPGQIEAEAIREHNKVLQLSPAERRQMGERYVDDILEVYRDNLLDKGVVSISSLDSAISELRRYYTAELEKDINGLPNGLYTDPNFDELIKQIDQNRPSIAQVSPGENMTFEDADSGHVNPNYGKNTGYSFNCQSCVVVFEARERGYNVQVLPYTKGSALEKLSRDPRMAWIDPKTGKHPEYLYDSSRRTPESYLDFVSETVKPGHRYTIQFAWKGRKNSGHIVNIDRTPEGLLRIKDNQPGTGIQSEWKGDFAVLEYLSRMKYEDKSIFGESVPCVPCLLRIDNMDFDFSMASNIMEGVENAAINN